MRPRIKTVKDKILKSEIRHDIAVFSAVCILLCLRSYDRPDRLITRCIRFVSYSHGISPFGIADIFSAHHRIRTSVSAPYSARNNLQRKRIHSIRIYSSLFTITDSTTTKKKNNISLIFGLKAFLELVWYFSD